MRKLPVLLSAAVSTVAIVTAGCGTVAPYAARVDGSSISQRSLDDELLAIRASPVYQQNLEQQFGVQAKGTGRGTFDAAFAARVLTVEVYYQLVHRELAKRGLRITDADIADAQKNALDGLGGDASQGGSPTDAQRLLEKFPSGFRATYIRREAELDVLGRALLLAGAHVSSVQQYVEQNPADFQVVCASHILVDTKAEADDVEARLADGQDFGAVAKAVSKDPGSASHGGDLGCAVASQYVAEFADAVSTQPIGKVGPPVQTQFGFHVILVRDRRTATGDELRRALHGALQNPLRDWLRTALQGAKVSVNPKYGSYDPNQGAITPPSGPPTTVATAPAGPSGPGGPGASGGGPSGPGASEAPVTAAP